MKIQYSKKYEDHSELVFRVNHTSDIIKKIHENCDIIYKPKKKYSSVNSEASWF